MQPQNTLTVLLRPFDSPTVWIHTILQTCEQSHLADVAHNLVGAILQIWNPRDLKRRTTDPERCAREQRSDFDVHRFSYYVGTQRIRAAIRYARENATTPKQVVLIVPANKRHEATVYAKHYGVERRLAILSLQAFIVQSVLSISNAHSIELFTTMKAIIDQCNLRASGTGDYPIFFACLSAPEPRSVQRKQSVKKNRANKPKRRKLFTQQ